AEVPDVCTVLHNQRGSAPGMWFITNDEKKTVVISLPGVPHEMKGLITDEVIPRLQQHYSLPAIVHRTASTAGAGESMIAEQLVDFENALPASIKLAYLPSFGMVKLRLTLHGEERERAEKELVPYFESLKEKVAEWIISDIDEPIEQIIGKILTERKQTMATAESCTGGKIATLLTAIPGSSAYFNGSVIAYSNKIKETVLNVSPDILQQHGAVSQQTVIEMVKSSIAACKSTYAIATSGIMGPGGGSEQKPVGTVWLAAGNAEKIETHCLHLRFDRARNIDLAATQALLFLRRFILANT
ncbi:MAG: nicotinamide-nucleotide amidohydrolase family protein, partial [Sphingobacteriales bacterium]